MFTLTAQDRHGIIISNCGEKLDRFTKVCLCLLARDHKGLGNQQMTGVIEHSPKINVIGELNQSGHDHDKRVHNPAGLSPTLTAVAGGTHHVKVLIPICPQTYRVRRLTPTEYGRLQAFSVDNGWEQVVSDSQAYKQFGNAVTVTVAQSVAESCAVFLNSINKQNELKTNLNKVV